ncbi:hypothetical protein J7K86_00525 [bacterium]|nr:hypothetical protein [bacterium]
MVSKQNKKMSHIKVPMLLVFFIFLIVAFISFLFFNGDLFLKKSKDINLVFDGPNKVKVGENVDFLLRIENYGNLDIQSGDFTLNFPEGFYLDESSKNYSEKLVNGCNWHFDRIRKGRQEFLRIRGRFFSPSHSLVETKKFKGMFDFHLAGLTSSFQKTIEKDIFVDSAFSSELKIPKELSVGQVFTWQYKIENKTNYDFENLRISLETPKNFLFLKLINKDKDIQESENFNGEKIFLIESLKAQEIRVIDFSGVFNGPLNKNDNQIKITASLKSPNGRYYDQNVILQKLNSLKSDIIFSLKVENGKKYFSWGDEIPLILTYQNNGLKEIQNLGLEVEVENAHFFSWPEITNKKWLASTDSITKRSGYWQIRDTYGGKKIIWNRLNLPNFKVVKTGSSGKIRFKLKLISRYRANKNRYVNPLIKFKVNLICRPVFSTRDLKLQVNGPEIKVRTNVFLSGEARYYDDENIRVGSGPIPPKVNRETRYLIYWRVENTCNSVNNLYVETVLPKNVIFTNKISASIGEIEFDENNRKVIWHIGNLLPYRGGPFSSIEARFEVAVVPDDNDIGHVLPLTSVISLHGIDKWTEEDIFREINFLDTNIESDPIVSGKGKVVK